MDKELRGRSIIGFSTGADSEESFRAFDPEHGEPVEPFFHCASPEELENAALLAEKASYSYEGIDGDSRGAFLREIARELLRSESALIKRAALETGLPEARFAGELRRTCSQLEMFAGLVEEGSWVDARIDSADPLREPIPKPDVRSMYRPAGPVAVFCAANFPIAFSVAGGDTASALAAGCPVIVNAHYAHPGTAEIAGRAISEAARASEMPEGVFSLLFSSGHTTGQALVRHRSIKSVGFTGSRAGGRSLARIAAEREVPIPVFAEMSSVNPVFLLPGALRSRHSEIAAGLHASYTLGVGQFCTKPGIVVLPDGDAADRFVSELTELTSGTQEQPLLTEGIRDAFFEGIKSRRDQPAQVRDATGFRAPACVLETSAAEFLSDPAFQTEIFGPATQIVRARDHGELLAVARALEGQLTATIHAEEEEIQQSGELVSILRSRAGRLVFNGFPTGVEVGAAMVHGGPFPSTSDSRATSVGTRAIYRFCCLTCYQDFPQSALPKQLRDGNPLGITRIVDGEIRG